MASYLTKMLHNTRNIIQGTWRRFDNVMHGTCRKCRAEDVTMHQEGVASHLKKMLLRIRNIWQVTVRRGDNVSGRACNLRTSREMLQRIRNVWQATWRRCCKIPGTSFKGLEPVSPKPTPSVPKCPQVSPSVNLKGCIPWSWFPKPTPSVPKCPRVSPKPTPSVPKCPQVSPKPTPSVPKC